MFQNFLDYHNLSIQELEVYCALTPNDSLRVSKMYLMASSGNHLSSKS